MTPLLFDIKLVNSRRYQLQTRSGKIARVLCTDLKTNHYKLVVAVTEKDGEEAVKQYTLLGVYELANSSSEDLVFVKNQRYVIHQTTQDNATEYTVVDTHKERIADSYHVTGNIDRHRAQIICDALNADDKDR